MASVESPGALPFTCPKCIKLVVLAADFYYLVALVLTLLLDCEKHLAWHIVLRAVSFCFLDETVAECSSGNCEGLITDDLALLWVEWVEGECDLENSIIVGELALICSFTSTVSSRRDQSDSSVWKSNMIPMRLIPLPQSCKYVRILINFILSSSHCAEMEEHVLDFSSWRDFNQILKCFDLV